MIENSWHGQDRLSGRRVAQASRGSHAASLSPTAQASRATSSTPLLGDRMSVDSASAPGLVIGEPARDTVGVAPARAKHKPIAQLKTV